MQSGDPLANVPDNSDAGRIAALESQLAAVNRQLSGAGAQIGDYVYTSNFPSNWNTSGTVILVGNRCVPNGVSLTKTDFPDLSTLYSGWGYPWGSTSTTFGIPDMLGRIAVCIGSHADVNALADSDGQTLANRTPKHNTSNNLSVTAGSLAVTPNPHSHTGAAQGGNVGASGSNFVVTSGAANTSSTSLSITGSPSLSGTVGPGGARPTDMPAYEVGGIWMLIVLP